MFMKIPVHKNENLSAWGKWQSCWDTVTTQLLVSRVTALDPEAKKAAGPGKDAYRCQICKTIYVEDSPYAAKKGK